MFTGLVEFLAEVVEIIDEPPGKRVVVRQREVAATAKIGESIAINGCCLTVIDIQPETFAFQAGSETLSRTNLGRLGPGDRINLERSLKVGESLGGHFVTGHIDGLGDLESRIDEGDWSTCWFATPKNLMRHLASKGSIAVDGVSLTVVDVELSRFSVALIPHTLSMTTLGALKSGDPVNLETDLLAKYVEKQLAYLQKDRD